VVETEDTVGAVVSVVVVLSVVPVVVVLSVVPVAEYSSLSSLQEMMVRLKRDMRIMDKTLFIFSSIPKVKYYGFVY
jgi:glycerol-3-phosphate acyltransferase PlsY